MSKMPSTPSQQQQASLKCIAKLRCFAWVITALVLSVSAENCRLFSSAADIDTSDEHVVGERVCSSSSADPTCSRAASTQNVPPLGRPLRPTDLPQPIVFEAFESNSTITLPGGIQQDVASGTIKQINNFDNPHRDDVLVEFAVLPSAVKRSSIESMRSVLQNYADWDDDPDTIDGMKSHEMFVDTPQLYNDPGSAKYRDGDPNFVPARKELRRKLTEIMSPYLERVITPMVHARYPEACTAKGPERACAPCYSLIRKYERGQRQSHDTHYDGHALVTVVVSLSDYDVDYRGGLYVSSGFGQREFMALNKGDAVMHQSSLLHGVQVYDLKDDPARTERWSWILWYKDSSTCEKDYGYEWFGECAREGDALCQQLHATKVGATPGFSHTEAARKVLELNMLAADGGSGYSAVKIARAYAGQLPSTLPLDMRKATEYYKKAIGSNNPDGHYGMSHMMLKTVETRYGNRDAEGQRGAWEDPLVKRAVDHLEKAAYAGHAFAKFNLGIVHTYGYDGGIVDAELAGLWFEACGLPEGYFVAAHQATAAGDAARKQEMINKANATGFFMPWRVQAREATGSGGAGGVDINLPWPPAFDLRMPQRF